MAPWCTAFVAVVVDRDTCEVHVRRHWELNQGADDMIFVIGDREELGEECTLRGVYTGVYCRATEYRVPCTVYY